MYILETATVTFGSITNVLVTYLCQSILMTSGVQEDIQCLITQPQNALQSKLLLIGPHAVITEMGT